MLNRYGLAAIWQLHLSAAKAYRAGNGLAALSMLDIADAAERIWLRRSQDNRTGSPQQRGVGRPSAPGMAPSSGGRSRNVSVRVCVIVKPLGYSPLHCSSRCHDESPVP